MALKYKVGDRVRIKSLDWYNANKDEYGYIYCGSRAFFTEMSNWCGKILTIRLVVEEFEYYCVSDCIFSFTDKMIEGLVEEENNDCKKCGLTHNSTRCLFVDNCPHNKQKNIIEIPKDYVIKDENGNVINATRIVLEKKKKEYPKTYEECYKIMGVKLSDCYIQGYKSPLLEDLQELLICRDAYWKIAGEEMGLGDPWEPDWLDDNLKPCIGTASNEIIKCTSYSDNTILAFPTKEMRDAFYENFKELIEQCKELL